MPLEGQRIFVVEDEILIALDIEDLITASKGEVAGRAATLAEAIRLADTPGLSLAVLDFHLGPDNSLPVAAKLNEAGVPFLFHTGRDFSVISEAWPQAPVVAKTGFRDELLSAMVSLAENRPFKMIERPQL